MTILSFTFDRATIRSIKHIGIPVLVILTVFLVSLGLYKEGIPRITTLRKQLSDSRRAQTVLENKISILKEVRDSNLIQVDTVYVALPEKNPAPLVISHIKTISETHGITLRDLDLSKPKVTETANGLNSAELEFDISSKDMTSLINFLLDIRNVSPIINMDEIEIGAEVEGTFASNVKTFVYWASLPETLPSLTEAIDTLTSEEQQLIGRVSNLKMPVFTKLDPQPPGIREVPFN